MKPILGWYFSENNKRLRYGNNRVIRPGITHKVKFPCVVEGVRYTEPTLCCAGVHASKRIIDALSYAPGNYVWRVELSGDVVIDSDKIVAKERKYLWGYNADEVLQLFSRRCALDVIHLWNAPDVVVLYLKTGDETIRDVARVAASEAARAAASEAAQQKQNQRLTAMINNGA